MAFSKINAVLFIILILLESCMTPGYINETSVFKSKGMVFNRFKPIITEQYTGDTLISGNYLIVNYKTASSFKGVNTLDINEDSVMNIAFSVFDRIGMKTKKTEVYCNLLLPEIFFDFKFSLIQRLN